MADGSGERGPGPAGCRRRGVTWIGAALGLGLLSGLAGCFPPLIGADVASYVGTGKGLGEHALDAVTGEDCRVIEGLMRSDRAVCEQRGAIATATDFKGIFGLETGQTALAGADDAARPVPPIRVVCILAGGAELTPAARRSVMAERLLPRWTDLPGQQGTVWLTYDAEDRHGTLKTARNTGGAEAVHAIGLLRLEAGSGVTFIGFDAIEGGPVLVSYFPETKRLMLSRHGKNDNPRYHKNLASVLLGDCREDTVRHASVD